MSVKEVIAAEEDVDWLRLEKPARTDIHVRLTNSFDHTKLASLPAESSLLAVSNLWGLCFIGDETSLKVYRVAKLAKQALESSTTSRAEPEQSVELQSRPQWIRLAMGDRKVITGSLDGTVNAWDIKDILTGTAIPERIFEDATSPILNLLPNPSPEGGLPQLVLALTMSSLVVLDIGSANKVIRRIDQGFTSVAWSPKGKQFLLGKADGTLEQYTPEGEKKAEIPLPSALASEGGYFPVSINWLENDLLLVTYNTQIGSTSEPVNDQKQYLVHRQPKATPPVFTFTLFEDILPAWGLQRSGNYRNVANIKNWGTRLRHLTFLSSAPAIDVAILQGNSTSNPAEVPVWDVIRPDESARPGVPMREETDPGDFSDDATALGLAIDLTSEENIQQEMEGGEPQPDLPPAPRLLEYTSDGILIIYNVINSRDGPYGGMVKAQDILKATESQGTPALTAIAQSPFGTTGTGAKPAVSAFGSSSGSKPTFGFGGSVSIPTVSSGFGGTNAFTNAKATTAAPAFGASSFGVKSSSPSVVKPAFGAVSFGQADGSSAIPSTEASFGTGASAFATSSTPVKAPGPAGEAPKTAFGTNAFGGTSAFGQTAFGSATPTTPAFGTSAFGSGTQSSPAFGASAFGSSSPFGSSAFAKSSTVASSSDTPKANTSFGFGSSPATKPSPAGVKPSSAFGSSSAFGQSPFATTAVDNKANDDRISDNKVKSSPFSLDGLGDQLDNQEEETRATESTAASDNTPSKTTSSFIKPAQSGSFFAHASARSSSASTDQPSDAKASNTAQTTGVQFGQSSAFGSTKLSASTPSSTGRPAFGMSTFGTSASHSTTPTSQPPIPKPIQATGGFAGFSTPTKSGSPSGFSSAGGFSVFGAAGKTPSNANASPLESEGGIKAPQQDFESPKDASEPARESTSDKSTDRPTQSQATDVGEGDQNDNEDNEEAHDVDSAIDTSGAEKESINSEKLTETHRDEEISNSQADSQSSGRSDDELDVYTYCDQENDSALDEDHSAVQEISSGENSETDSSSGVLVENPDSVTSNKRAESEDASATENASFTKGHVRKTSKVQAAAHEWENLATGSETTEPVKNSPTRFSFDVPPTSGTKSSQSTVISPPAEQAKTSPPNFFGMTPASDTTTPVSKPATPFSFGALSASKAGESGNKASFAGVGMQPPASSTLHSKPNVFGFRAPTAVPAKSSPLVNASLPAVDSEDIVGYDLSQAEPTPTKKHLQTSSRDDILSSTPTAKSAVDLEASSSLKSALSSRPPTTNIGDPADQNKATDLSLKPESTSQPSVPSEPNHGLALAFADAFSYLEQELQSLKLLADENESFHSASSAVQGQMPTKDDVPHAEFWYLSALDIFAQATRDSYESADRMQKAGVELSEEVKKATASMNEGESMMRFACARYKRARTDLDFRRRHRARQLRPQQAEDQILLQASYKNVVSKLNEIEEQITDVKRKTSQERTGRMPLRPSALASIDQSLRFNEDKVIQESQTLHELSQRVKMLSVKARDEDSLRKVSAQDSGDRESQLSRKRMSTADIASSALNAEHDAMQIRSSLLKIRKQPLFNDSSNERSSALNRQVKSSTPTKRSGTFGVNLPSTPSKVATPASAPSGGFASVQLPTNGSSFFNIVPPAMSGLKSSFRATSKTSEKKHSVRGFSAYSPSGSDGH
ncbi:hypothetical protein QFC19_006706 [Naganishia cerealis]|uniref:Uncharacterized protein n=1 Tax=Naganishia cerealis TaxID=610337 RepID=A0ACC2VG35_9TREE|nr:hypothetical protein QFC19_006706 [Naganishia cerealis]